MFSLYMQEGGRAGKTYLGGDTVDTTDSHDEGDLGLRGDVERTGSLGLSSQADLVILQLRGREGRRRGEREEGCEWMCACMCLFSCVDEEVPSPPLPPSLPPSLALCLPWCTP